MRRAMRNRTMRPTHRVLALVTGVMLTACTDLLVPDYNNPSVQDLTTTPSVAAIQSAALGILAGWRGNGSSQGGSLGPQGDAGFAAGLTTYGREAWEIQPTNPSLLRNRVLTPIGLSSGFVHCFRY